MHIGDLEQPTVAYWRKLLRLVDDFFNGIREPRVFEAVHDHCSDRHFAYERLTFGFSVNQPRQQCEVIVHFIHLQYTILAWIFIATPISSDRDTTIFVELNMKNDKFRIVRAGKGGNTHAD